MRRDGPYRTVAWLPQRFIDRSIVEVQKMSSVKMVSLLARLAVFTAVVLLLIFPVKPKVVEVGFAVIFAANSRLNLYNLMLLLS